MINTDGKLYWLEVAPSIAFLRALSDSGLLCSKSGSEICADCKRRPVSGQRSPYCIICKEIRSERHRRNADSPERRRSRRMTKCPQCDGPMWKGSTICRGCVGRAAAA